MWLQNSTKKQKYDDNYMQSGNMHTSRASEQSRDQPLTDKQLPSTIMSTLATDKVEVVRGVGEQVLPYKYVQDSNASYHFLAAASY